MYSSLSVTTTKLMTILYIVLFMADIPSAASDSITEVYDGSLIQNQTMISASRKRPFSKNSQPPFAKFLRSSKDRQELLRIIKVARRNRTTKQEIQLKIDRFLREHLHDDDYRKVEQLREEGRILNHEPLFTS
ncbi:hypothetical protein V3C99_014930 [Haemonchus contortus]